MTSEAVQHVYKVLARLMNNYGNRIVLRGTLLLKQICRTTKSFKDPVHGFSDICEELSPLVDSWILQRLRNIKQTAFAYLVYHGMEHSRFNHSIGSAHLAKELLGFITSNTDYYYQDLGGRELSDRLSQSLTVFQLAALLHDVGHLPFSHSTEVGISEARYIYGVPGVEKLPLRHEEYTFSLVPHAVETLHREGIEIEPVFTDRLEDDIQLVLGRPQQSTKLDPLAQCTVHILYMLLSSGLDVDRMDYLLRDSLYAGVHYGLYDIGRLTRVILATPLLKTHSGELSRKACRVAILDKGISVLESFLLARLYMYSEVYLHRVVETYNALYARLFSLLTYSRVIGIQGSGAELEIPTPDDIRSSKTDAINAWRNLDDISMISLFREIVEGKIKSPTEARVLAAMIIERRHPKLYQQLDDPIVWGLYREYLSTGYAPSWARPFLEELVDLQRETPLVMLRPLRIDLVSIDKIGVYYRDTNNITLIEEDIEKTESRQTHINRLKRLADLNLRRIVLIADKNSEKEFKKAEKILLDLSAEKRFYK